jgi:hypothetical protein
MSNLLELTLLLAQDSRPAPARGDSGSAPARTETVFSGPQKGEKVPSFRVVDVTGARKEREFDPTKEAASAPALYFFFVNPNRVVARTIKVIDAMAREGSSHGLRAYFIGLLPDRLEGDQRLRDAWSSLKPFIPVCLSPDGVEGPGSWGLNKQCQVTVVVAKDGKVVANVSALSPGDQDFEAIRAALQGVLGKPISPALYAPDMDGRGGSRGDAAPGGMTPPSSRPGRP